MRSHRFIVGAGLVLLIGSVTGWYAHHRHRYPFGWSHCCDKALALELQAYADAHQGWFPRGESCPEASLGLLYGGNPDIGQTLRGKTVPTEVTVGRLQRGEPLTPETCGWQYVEGLRNDDDVRLALFWDKAGLGHNGERLSGGGHIVHFVRGDQRHVPAAEWDDFLSQQALLRATLKR